LHRPTPHPFNAGTLPWADGTYKPNTTVLRDTYPLTWKPYAQLHGPAGEFRYLAEFVSPQPPMS
jgi:hypothetical protein